MSKTLLSAAALALCSLSAQATTYSYADFSDLSDFQLNGSTASISNPTANDALRLTNGLSQSGSAFLTNTISLSNDASFSAAFQFQITNPMGISDSDGQGADGIVFVIQTVSNTAGGSGGGIGYQGLANSVGIEFDTWDNGSWDDYNGNHVGIDIGGNINSAVQQAIGTRMNNGAVWSAWVDYSGATDLLEVYLSETNVRAALPTLSYTVDLSAVLGSSDAYIGFTSGTGAAGGYHDILNLTFVDDYAPIDVPAPATLAALVLGLAGFSVRRKANKA